VVDRDGGQIGRAEEVIGDEERDIFDGLAVATKLLGKPRYLPSERVTTIVEGRVGTDLPPADVHALPPYDPRA
jgi:hypothetical protein